ncbi:hypothetical protein [Corynebacterium sp. HMSC27B11]|uniref:hypothetical protein n=1 Tax=Corynebacterium sp. HMSC27B11 TaxID=1581065 RepID=UPI0008A60D2B|nr:hypothetical protein [Corynebacterium sp. HMSC27B11]OFS17810.1 hypothetical protein HMPREF3097_04100 [Corynebacterium sp. HMSC27B11]
MAAKKKHGGSSPAGGTPPQDTRNVVPVRALTDFDGLPEAFAQGEDAPILATSAWGGAKGQKQQIGLVAWGELPAVNAADPFVIASPHVPSEVRLYVRGEVGTPDFKEPREPLLIAEAGEARAGAEVRRTLLGTMIHPPAELLAEVEGSAGLRATVEALWITEDGDETVTWAVRLSEDTAE